MHITPPHTTWSGQHLRRTTSGWGWGGGVKCIPQILKMNDITQLRYYFLKIFNEWSFVLFLVILFLSFNQIDLLHLLPIKTDKVILKEILSIKISFGELGIALLFLLIILKWIMEGKMSYEKYDKKYLLFILSFFVSISLSTMFARMPYPAVKEIIQYSGYILIWYLIIVDFIDIEKNIWILVKFLSFAGAFLAFLGIVQFWVASVWHINILQFLVPLSENDTKLWFSEFTPRIRTTSLFINPNSFGSFLVLIVPLSLVSWLKERRAIYSLLSLIILTGIITNYSPGAFLGLISSIFIFTIFHFKRIPYSITISGLSSFFILLSSYIFYPSYFSQVIDYLVEAASFRILLWKEALRIFSIYPFWGIGLNNFWWHLSPWWGQNHSYLADAHNFIFNLLAETGIIGTLTFFGILFYPIYRILPIMRYDPLLLGLLAGVGGCLVTAFFNSPAMFTRGTGLLFWLELHLLVMYLSLLNAPRMKIKDENLQAKTLKLAL